MFKVTIRNENLYLSYYISVLGVGIICELANNTSRNLDSSFKIVLNVMKEFTTNVINELITVY